MIKEPVVVESIENPVTEERLKSELRVCVSCQAPVTTRFCGYCGRKVQQHSVMLDMAVHSLQVLMNMDGRWRRTVADLFLRPAELIHRYLHGERHLYANPVLMLLVLTSLSILLLDLLQVDYHQYSSNDRLVELIQWVTVCSGYLSVGANLLTARLSRRFYPDTDWSGRFVMLTYASVFSTMIAFPLMLIAFLLGHDLTSSYLMWVGQVSACWIYWSFRPSVASVIKLFILNFVVFMLFFALVGIGAGFYVEMESILSPVKNLPQLLNPEPLY